MHTLNKVTLIGNVTRDPDIRATTTGRNVANVSMATNTEWRDAQGVKQSRAEYHSVVLWGHLAGLCEQFVRRGSRIYVEGNIQTREYTTQDGQRKTRTEIVGESLILLSEKKDPSQAPMDVTAGLRATTPPKSVEDIRLEDVPF